MLDLKRIRDNPEDFAAAARSKNFPVDVDRILELDATCRQLQIRWEALQAERNRASKHIGREKNAAVVVQMRQNVLKIKAELDQITESLRDARSDLRSILLRAPQPAAPDVPLGRDDTDNVEIRRWGTPRPPSSTPRDHVEIATRMEMLDIARGVKISGSRSYLLRAEGARLEQALFRYGMAKLRQAGFIQLSVPTLVHDDVMEGTGYFPIGEEQAYRVERDKMSLVGTAEVSMCALHRDEILSHEVLPLRYMAQSTCYRREAGSYGRDTHGLYRVHQFQKLEMVVLCEAEEAEDAARHNELLSLAEEMLRELELPYRVVYVCTGDLGQGQVRKHDLETWMPSRQAYGETHSCSSFLEFQSRRLNIRYKDADGNSRFVYTLNNTYMATPRLMIPLIENHQNAGGTFDIPQVLIPYMD